MAAAGHGSSSGHDNRWDECHYDADGHLTSLLFRDGHQTESTTAVTRYLEAGVLELASTGATMAESFAALGLPVRGGSNFSLTLGDMQAYVAAANSSGSSSPLGLELAVRPGRCRLAVERQLRLVSSVREGCARFMSRWIGLFGVLGFGTTLYFGRVLFSYYLQVEASGDIAQGLNGRSQSKDIGVQLQHIRLEEYPDTQEMSTAGSGGGSHGAGGPGSAAAPRRATHTVSVPDGVDSAGFTCDEQLVVRRLDETCLAVDAGVELGMELVSFQGKALPGAMTWAALKSAVRASAKPWTFGFARSAPPLSGMSSPRGAGPATQP
eukprot:COSAG01_NODE_1668_length_9563_cov_23.675613_10_plen_323_part_00